MNDNHIIPPPVQSQLALPVNFWVKIIAHLDAKVNLVLNNPGYGKVGVELTIANHEIRDIIFEDKINMRGLVKSLPDKKLSLEFDKKE